MSLGQLLRFSRPSAAA
jgi:hypothetical protein